MNSNTRYSCGVTAGLSEAREFSPGHYTTPLASYSQLQIKVCK